MQLKLKLKLKRQTQTSTRTELKLKAKLEASKGREESSTCIACEPVILKMHLSLDWKPKLELANGGRAKSRERVLVALLLATEFAS